MVFLTMAYENAGGILLELHGRLVRALGRETGQQFQGLASAGSWLRKRCDGPASSKKATTRSEQHS